MKKYLLVIIMMAFALCASAQGAYPTKQDFDSKCNTMLNNINVLKSKLDNIKMAELDILQQQKPNEAVAEERLLANDSLIDKAYRIVVKVQACYEADSTSNISLLALQTVGESLQAYVSVVFQEPEAKNIKVSDGFEKVVKEQLLKLDKVLQNLEEFEKKDETPDSEVQEDGKKKTEKSWDLPIIIEIMGFSIVLCVIGIVFLHLKSVCIKNQREIQRLKEELGKEIRINNEDISNLSDCLERKRNNIDSGMVPKGLTQEQIQEIIQKELTEREKVKEINKVPGMTNDCQSDKSHNVHNATVKTQDDYHLYGQLQNDGSFKVSQSDSRNAFYILKLKDSKAEQAEFFLKEFDNDTAKAIIEGRQMKLVPACDIESSAGLQKIIVVKPGIAEKQGNLWLVKSKAQIKLVNA